MVQWLAYWAAGHHLNVTEYRGRIYNLLGSMHRSLAFMMPRNRCFANRVLWRTDMKRLELILRGTRPSTYSRYGDSALEKLADEYMEKEEKRLKGNLAHVNYQLDEAATVSIVAGYG